MDEFDSLFGSKSEVTDEEVISTEAEALEAEVEEVVEEVVEETAAETEVSPAPQVVEETSTVPLAALHSEREKLKTSKAEAEALRQQIADMKAAAQNNTNRPDPYDDPEGYARFMEAHFDQVVEQKMAVRAFNEARARAVESHGEEFVQELADWADSYALTVDPNIGDKALATSDPLQFLISARKRHQSILDLEADEEAFIRRKAAELGIVPSTVAAPVVEALQPTPKKSVGPRSLASISNRENNSRKGPEDYFDAIFK